ncbi:glycoside hydrolase family 3 N-terminal domain-containing protein [Nocardioides sp. Kera G14]|uniref:beta-xylosidase/alpha-l-arabinosidase n=1 Tax=Nocardioides sp. Kera G14 TaxID=2884264 RepID=UPI001D1180F6|nr:glycoside hydrolase family 3 N-terminal domain-containing protein [Nocardioides sp. Kera G14]UDY24951.1 glycoside hydrolase family 3 C-terminal domain-containing protein [Nocardioides sp. Kera G14]
MTSTPLRAMPQVSDRVADLLARMTLEEKLAQIVGFWVDHGGEVVAPMADEMTSGLPTKLTDATVNGLGHYTRVYGTRPVDPAERAAWLAAEQRRLRTSTRLGIPALVHEECLTGLAAWKAAAFPTPLAWGATFDPDAVEEMAHLIGSDMRALGIHQGLAPVLDVIRDPRWGRTEEAIAEDPYVVGTIGTAYVRGLQAGGVHATLKHFVGYSGSRAGRNHAPVSAGPRELADVFLPPFEMALLDGGARSVMNSYTDIDGIPVASHTELLTGLLREKWGFDGVVVADYFAVAFLAVMHAIAADRGEAAALALEAGIDIELPTGDAYLAPLAALVRAGTVDESLIDRAVSRALSQKEELGLLDGVDFEAPESIDLDSPTHRELARRLAEESVVLLSNNGVLPLRTGHGDAPSRVAVIGPNADRAEALMGCYSFANHVLVHTPDVPLGIEVPTIAEALRTELGAQLDAEIVVERGCDVESEDRSGFSAAVAAASSSDVAILVMGDQAGLFGRGTVGEGNDAESLDLPGVQRELVEAVVATGTPVVLVLVTGRPYVVGWALDGADVPAAVVQSFFPGEEGGPAIARVLSGAVNPSGRLPVSLPRASGAQPYSYAQPLLGGPSEVTSTDPTPVRSFGFGLSYTSFGYSELTAAPEAPTDGSVEISVRVTNHGSVAGTDVVQLYGRDLLASVVRPVVELLGYTRVTLEAGESKVVRFTVPTRRFSFTDRALERVVEPGDVEIWVAASAGEKVDRVVAEGIADTSTTTDDIDPPTARVDRVRVRLTGDVHRVTQSDPRVVTAVVESAPTR